nr:MAG: putative capsid protein [Trichoderma harzianum dsRNA virus 3]
MSLYTKKDLTAVRHYVSGVELDPCQTAEEFVLNGPLPSGVNPCTLDLSPLEEDDQLAAGRWKAGKYDCKYALVATYEGARKLSTNVGREWSAFGRGFNVKFVPSGMWGDEPMALVPAVASLATNDLEAGSMTSWASLHTLLGANPAGIPLDRQLLTNLNRIQGGKANSVRFIHRLAALFWHSIVSDGGKPVEVEIRQPARALHYNTVAALSNEVEAGLTGVQYVPWSANSLSDSQTVVSVLWAAACGKVSSSAGRTSRFLRYWPELGHQVVVVVDDGALSRGLVGLARVKLDPMMVWFTAMRWCAKYSSVGLFEEAVSFLGGFCFSPANGIFPVNDTVAEVALPPSSMGLFAAAQIIQPKLVLNLGNVPAMPSTHKLAERAVLQSMLLSLLNWHDLYRVVGWYYRHGLTNDADAAEYCRRFARHADQVGAWGAVNSNVQQYAKGDLGRIWSRVASLGKDRYKQTTEWAARAVQWEEIANRTRKLPASSSVYGVFMPLLLNRQSVAFGEWARVADMPDKRSADQAFFGLRTVAPNVDYRIRLSHPLATNFIRLQMPVSYRGTIADHAFMSGVARSGEDFEPIFCVTKRSEYYRATDKDTHLYHYRWFVESVGKDVTEWLPKSAVLAPPAAPTAITGGPPVDDGQSDTDVSDLGGDEFSVTSDIEEVAGPPVAAPKKGTSLQVVVPDGVDETDALFHALSAAQTPQERGSELFKMGLRYEQLLRNGVPTELVKAYSTLRILGVPPAGAAIPSYSEAMNEVRKQRTVETLTGVKPAMRQRILDIMIEEQLDVVRNCHPGSSQVECAQVLRGMYSIRLGLSDSTALTAREYWDALGRKERLGLGVKEPGGVPTTKDYDLLPAVTRGRLATDEMSKELLLAGIPVSQGIGARLSTASKQAREQPAMAVDSVGDLITTMIQSAFDAGEQPDREMLVSLCEDANLVDSLLQKMDASANVEESGFRSGMRKEGESQSASEESGAEGTAPASVGPWRPKSVSTLAMSAEAQAMQDAARHSQSQQTPTGAGLDTTVPRPTYADITRTRPHALTSVGEETNTPGQSVPANLVSQVATAAPAPGPEETHSPTTSSQEGPRVSSPHTTAGIGQTEVAAASFSDPLAGKRGSED